MDLHGFSTVNGKWFAPVLPPENFSADQARRYEQLLAAIRLQLPGMQYDPFPSMGLAAGAAVRTYRGADPASIAVDRRDRARVAVVGSGDLRDRVSPALADAGLRESEVADATVVILADAQHPDVPAFFDHDVQDLPHLNVALLGAVATVGPLVVPGRTSCLRCAHLHRRDADPAWPLLAVQWSQAVKAMPYPPIDPVLAAVAAGHAALMVRAWADAPEDPGTWADVAVTIRLPGGDVTRIPRPVHPLCGCRWPGDARSAAGRPDHPDATG